MSGRRVRPAGVDDIDAIAALEQDALGRDAWSRGLIAEGVRGLLPTTHYLVATLDDGLDDGPDLAAYAVVSVAGGPGGTAELQRIATAAPHRRRGLARLLLEQVDAVAARAEADRLLLEVREDNAGAIGLYSAVGFVELARRPRYYRDGATALVMQRAVTPSPGDRQGR